MNRVLRVITDQRTFIVKQARPWVEKYPQIQAPVERASVEARFFGLVNQHPVLQAFSPALQGFDATSFLLNLEDLGAGADYTYLYQKGQYLSPEELGQLVQYLSALHQVDISHIQPAFPENTAMRQLNHEHIFVYPYLEENGFNLDQVQQGLQAIAMPYKQDSVLKEHIRELGALYLRPGRCLLQGDYYPGSWLRVSKGIRIIDPEFGFVGPPEFDLAVFMAHMAICCTVSTLH